MIEENNNDENLEPRRSRRKSQQMSDVTDEQVSISEKILMESASEKDRISVPKVCHSFLRILQCTVFLENRKSLEILYSDLRDGKILEFLKSWRKNIEKLICYRPKCDVN